MTISVLKFTRETRKNSNKLSAFVLWMLNNKGSESERDANLNDVNRLYAVQMISYIV